MTFTKLFLILCLLFSFNLSFIVNAEVEKEVESSLIFSSKQIRDENSSANNQLNNASENLMELPKIINLPRDQLESTEQLESSSNPILPSSESKVTVIKSKEIKPKGKILDGSQKPTEELDPDFEDDDEIDQEEVAKQINSLTDPNHTNNAPIIPPNNKPEDHKKPAITYLTDDETEIINNEQTSQSINIQSPVKNNESKQPIGPTKIDKVDTSNGDEGKELLSTDTKENNLNKPQVDASFVKEPISNSAIENQNNMDQQPIDKPQVDSNFILNEPNIDQEKIDKPQTLDDADEEDDAEKTINNTAGTSDQNHSETPVQNNANEQTINKPQVDSGLIVEKPNNNQTPDQSSINKPKINPDDDDEEDDDAGQIVNNSANEQSMKKPQVDSGFNVDEPNNIQNPDQSIKKPQVDSGFNVDEPNNIQNPDQSFKKPQVDSGFNVDEPNNIQNPDQSINKPQVDSGFNVNEPNNIQIPGEIHTENNNPNFKSSEADILDEIDDEEFDFPKSKEKILVPNNDQYLFNQIPTTTNMPFNVVEYTKNNDFNYMEEAKKLSNKIGLYGESTYDSNKVDSPDDGKEIHGNNEDKIDLESYYLKYPSIYKLFKDKNASILPINNSPIAVNHDTEKAQTTDKVPALTNKVVNRPPKIIFTKPTHFPAADLFRKNCAIKINGFSALGICRPSCSHKEIGIQTKLKESCTSYQLTCNNPFEICCIPNLSEQGTCNIDIFKPFDILTSIEKSLNLPQNSLLKFSHLQPAFLDSVLNYRPVYQFQQTINDKSIGTLVERPSILHNKKQTNDKQVRYQLRDDNSHQHDNGLIHLSQHRVTSDFKTISNQLPKSNNPELSFTKVLRKVNNPAIKRKESFKIHTH